MKPLRLLGLTMLLCGGEARALIAPLDLSRSPDYTSLASAARAGALGDLRKKLGDALASSWQPARPGHRGSTDGKIFPLWVDLYQWIDLLGSDEAAVTKRWISNHLIAGKEEKNKEGTSAPLQVTVLQPGCPLVRRHDSLQHRVTEEIASNPVQLARVLQGLVAQPFASRNGSLAARLDPVFVAATVSDPVFLKHWSESFSPDDFAPKVLENLQEIWKANRSDWGQYPSLALAISTVMDQPAPSFWPHHQVAQGNVTRSTSPPSSVFAQWVGAWRDGKLRMDPRLMESRELKFVIDAPLGHSEWDSVRNNPVLSRQKPPQFFSSIPYDKGRVIEGIYLWPWGVYSLAAIREHGGICVDQAYYAAISGKALGIPTIFFAGQGNEGGHAWVGYLKGPSTWDLGVGRYAEQNYSTGEALDPQSWTPVTDHDLELLTRHLGNQDQQDAARRDLVLASDFRRMGDAPGEGRALASALTSCPENPALWDAKEDYLVRTGSPSAEIKAHHEAAIRQFSRFRDLKAQHQEALLRLALGAGDQRRADHLSDQIMHENRGGRIDLSAAAAAEMVKARLAANDPEAAVVEFSKQLKAQGRNGGGDFFYNVVAPLTRDLSGRGRQDLARKVLKDSFIMLNPPKSSLIDRDLRKLWKEAGGAASTPPIRP